MSAIFPTPQIGCAQSPFLYLSSRKRRSSLNITTISQPRPERFMTLGDLIHPDTGDYIGNCQGILPLPNIEGSNEAITVFGSSGSGKTVCLRTLIEHYAIEEGRCVIIIDPTKNQYWPFIHEQDRKEMIADLKRFNEKPTKIPDLQVYVPTYDEPVLGFDIMKRDYHATNLLTIRTSGLTGAGFFELGDIDPSGKMYQLYLEEIMNVPRSRKTVDYIRNQLYELNSDPSRSRSIKSLINLFEPLCNMGIIRDDGTDIHDMLHPPRTHKPGKISVISLGTSAANDRRKNALVSSLSQQLFDAVKDDPTIKPVFVLDETKEFAPHNRNDSPATYAMLSRIHLQCRAWGVTRIFGFQKQEHVADFLLGNNTPIQISMTKSLELSNGQRLYGTGLAHVYINGTGDPKVPDTDFLCKVKPCRTKHID